MIELHWKGKAYYYNPHLIAAVFPVKEVTWLYLVGVGIELACDETPEQVADIIYEFNFRERELMRRG